MKKLWSVSFAALGLSVILWTAGQIFFTLPDWAARANGAVMMVAMALLVFSGVRLKLKNS